MGPFGGIGLPEIIIVLVIVLVIFGPKRLPGLGRSLGSGLREFKDSVTSKDSESEISSGEGTRPTPSTDRTRSADEPVRAPDREGEPEPVAAEPVSGGSARSARDPAA